jgi:hypothetical protein
LQHSAYSTCPIKLNPGNRFWLPGFFYTPGKEQLTVNYKLISYFNELFVRITNIASTVTHLFKNVTGFGSRCDEQYFVLENLFAVVTKQGKWCDEPKKTV